MTTENFTLPAYWASALINDDWTDLDDTEEKEIKDWIAKTKKPYHRFNCLGTDGNEWFKWRNDATQLPTTKSRS